jgi:hypothetical protein
MKPLHPLDQNPTHQKCENCGEIADEWYNDQWLCEDCIQDVIDEDE